MKFEPLHHWIKPVSGPLLISGPCGAESFEQVMTTAAQLKTLNKVSLFRAGVWKPRTRPNAFEGMGEEALKWLVEVTDQTNEEIAIATILTMVRRKS